MDHAKNIRYPFIRAFLIVTAVLLALGSCAAFDANTEAQFEVPDQGPTDVGDIVYGGEDGNIYTVDSESGDITPITTQSERRGGRTYDFSQAIWSPDGSRISYAGSFHPEHTERQHFVYVNNVETGEIKVHESGLNQPPLYLQWSPDGSILSYVRTSQENRSIELVLWDTETDESTVVLMDRPIYYDWAPDASFLVAHGGGSSFQSTGGTVYIVRFDNEEQASEQAGDADSNMSFEVRQLSTRIGFFQTPVINPSGDVFAVSLEGNEITNRIAFYAPSGDKQEEVAAISWGSAFAWSPNGSRLAYLDGGPWQTGGILGTLRIVDRQGAPPAARRPSPQPVSTLVAQPQTGRSRQTGGDTSAALSGVNAFEWSPDGESIVYFQPNLMRGGDSERSQWETTVGVVDSVTGEAARLDPIIPTMSLQGTYIPHFDQYSRSGTLWSHDSETLLLNARTSEEDRPGIYLVDVSEMERRLIAHGHMPFWRPSQQD